MWKFPFLCLAVASATDIVIYETCTEFVEAVKTLQSTMNFSGECFNTPESINISHTSFPVPGICSENMVSDLGSCLDTPLLLLNTQKINGIDIVNCTESSNNETILRVRREEIWELLITEWYMVAMSMNYTKLEPLCDIGPTAHLNPFTALRHSECFDDTGFPQEYLVSEFAAPMIQADSLSPDSDNETFRITCGSTYSPPSEESSSSLALILGLTLGGLAIVSIAVYVYKTRKHSKHSILDARLFM